MLHVIFAAVSALAGATGTYVFLDAKHERELSDLRATQATALAKATSDALAETQRLQKAKDEAEKRAAKRLADARADAARASAAAAGLRDELATSRLQLSSASCTSVREYSATLSAVFGECSAEVGRLASEAQGHAVDSLKLQESWPSAKP